ncbi:phosphate-starvation-inducible PsiE family protein [Gemella sp. GH3]|uniref:phosphate-starvation-inducible PsiE family protein n=1 Tax=unclassified Gemella TaxID=2624949 RepID=UPI0015D00AFC|nr:MULTISPECIES: phosphate-starvation-inducible PsiE family protein [unclassified Gemella]MBF0713957.1 phosphate-starvation-inducible PsiE family protein [Gemella sp. GH3.1]NYS50909.1 phosphate-starvation-inducible PsiE family protein [Gemella sp. GH3]
MGKFEEYNKKLSSIILALMNIALLLVALALCVLLFFEAWKIVKLSIYPQDNNTFRSIIEEIIVFFLYFEFIALIVKYFKSKSHFPLRYFIYIGITAIIRLIIIDHDVAYNTLVWGSSIFLLSCSLAIVNKFVKHD